MLSGIIETVTGSNRYAILGLVVFFALGAFVRARLDLRPETQARPTEESVPEA